MKVSKFILAVIFLCSISVSYGQQEDYKKREGKQKVEKQQFEYNSDSDNGKKWDWSKVRIGGNFAFNFSNGRMLLNTSPTFGYRVHEHLELGAGFNSIYFRELNRRFDNSPNTYNYSSYTYGPLGYARAPIWNGIFVMTQYEMINKEKWRTTINDEIGARVNVHHLLIGGGYSQAIGNAGNLNIGLMYEVLNDPESLYQFGQFGNIPLHLTIGFGFGFGGGGNNRGQ